MTRLLVTLLAFLTFMPVSDESRAQFTAFIPGPDEGLFLLMTDIHFSPFGVNGLVPRLDKSEVSEWPSILSSVEVYRLATYGQDPGYPLIHSAIRAASSRQVKFDYVLYTGDHLSHNFKELYDAFAGSNRQGIESFSVKTTQYISQLLSDSFGGVPVLSVLGNEDSACGDYHVAPDGAYLAGVGPLWAKLSGEPDGFDTFSRYGTYKVAHPSVQNQDIIALNNIYWSMSYANTCQTDGGDPGSAVMTWLEQELSETAQAGRKAQILMHIPPGGDAFNTAYFNRVSGCIYGNRMFWQDEYQRQFLALMHKYAGTVDYTFSGHTHMDAFSVISDASGSPLVVNQISPSISSIFGNNPGFTVFLYNRTSGTILDSATFYASNLEAAVSRNSIMSLNWDLEYTYRNAYGLRDLSPASRADLAKRVQSDGATRRRFTDYYNVSLTPERQSKTPIANEANWPAYACALTNIRPKDYQNCVCDK